MKRVVHVGPGMASALSHRLVPVPLIDSIFSHHRPLPLQLDPIYHIKETPIMGNKRSQTVLNREHPKNMMYEAGDRAKNAVRRLSNVDLDAYFVDGMEDKKALADVLSWTRSKKLKFVKDCAMASFAKTYEEVQNAKQDEAKAAYERKAYEARKAREAYEARKAEAEAEPELHDCPECQGRGHIMEMKCYGDKPVEVDVDCENCAGDGKVEGAPDA